MKLTDPIIDGGPKVTVEYVAADSLGVKSMCTLVRTPELTVTVDPGASSQAASFPLPEQERRALEREYSAACRRACAESSAVVISHYHLDHFTPARDVEMYQGKTLFAKPLDDLPPKQAAKGQRFMETIDGLPSETVWAEGRRFKFGRTEIGFSEPVWHGRHMAEPGKVFMTEVKRGKEKLVITSDVGGPTESETTDLICASKPQTVILDGYPTYMLGQFATSTDLVRSLVNVCRILAMPQLRTLVIDHHVARDYRYPAYFRLAYTKAAELGKRFGTAAEILGRTSAVIQGYQDYGPTKWRKWAPLDCGTARDLIAKAVTATNLDAGWLAAFDRWV